MSPAPEPGTIKAALETLLKPFTLIFNPIAERIGNGLKRKPKLHIYVRPLPGTIWGYAWDGSPKPMMQARFVTNDGDEGILILDAYVKGSKPKMPLMQRIKVPPTTTVTDEIICVLHPGRR